MESKTRQESALETRIRLLREIQRSAAKNPSADAAMLAAIRELLQEAEAELGSDR